jgi:hypothetical protein
MNEKNLEYLKKLLFHLGFGEKLNSVLESAIHREKEKFTIGLSSTQRPLENPDPAVKRSDIINYQLNFAKGKENDTYYLNDYLVTLHKTGEPVARTQTFDLERDYRITALQAYKLLSGLSFEKEVYLRSGNERVTENEKVPMWFRLNLDVTDAYGNHPLRKMRPEYGYDLHTALDKYPLKFNNAEEKQEAIKKLAAGNYYHGNLKIGHGTTPALIAANPQMKTVDIFDAQLKEIRDADIWPERARTTVVQQPAAAEDRDTWEQEESLDESVKIGR